MDLIRTNTGIARNDFYTLVNFDNKVSSTTAYVYALQCAKFNKWLTAQGLPPEAVTGRVISLYSGFLKESEGLKAETINTALKALKRFYKALVHEEIVTGNPCNNIGYLQEQSSADRAESISTKTLSIEQVEILNRKLAKDTSERGLQRYAIFYTLIKCGLRASELANLRFENIIFEDGGTNHPYSEVKEKKENPVLIEFEGKGKKTRKVEFDRGILNHILEYHSRIDQHDFFFYTIPANGKQRRTPVDRYNLYHAVKRIGQIIGRKTWTHLLRHSYATISIQRGAKLQDVSSRLGHSSVDITMRFYEHSERAVLKYMDFI